LLRFQNDICEKTHSEKNMSMYVAIKGYEL
jgi:hypothetical protein